MKYIRRLAELIDSFNEATGYLVSWLTTLLVLVVSYDVVTRYLFRKSSVAVQELEWHLFAIIFLIGAGYTLKHDRHVRVDVIYAKLSEKKQAWVNLLGSLIFLIPFSILIIWTSKDFVVNSFLIKETSPDPGGLPARYILKASIPIGFFLLLLQGVSVAVKSLFTVIDKK